MVCSITSVGVTYLSVFLGRLLSCPFALFTILPVTPLKPLPLGKYCLIPESTTFISRLLGYTFAMRTAIQNVIQRALQGYIGVVLLFSATVVDAAEIRVAVASNFIAAAQELAQQFERESGHRVKLSFGSTGKHYAQILHGAPFDLFLAADVLRPQHLEQEGRIVPDSRFTYALGQLVLWSPTQGMVDPQGAVLKRGDFRYLAIANPKLAPYGRAAKEVIEALGMQQQLVGRMVRGESVGQAFQFVKSGNAALGLVAYAQVQRQQGSLWQIPESLYTPIEQQAVLLTTRPTATAFVEYLRSEAALEIIRAYGYRTP